jgi:UDP-3-O-[3-hydroxymyristoyl] glucosamine N-acyltransferase
MKVARITTGDLAQKLSCKVDGNPNLLLTGANTIEDSGNSEITFIANPKYRKHLQNCHAGAIIASASDAIPHGIVRIISEKPYLDFCRTLEIIYPDRSPQVAPGIHPTAVVSSNAILGLGVSIGPNAFIDEGACIGDGCAIYNGASIGRGVKIGKQCVIGVNVSLCFEVFLGDRVIVGDGTVIGFDGFGYAPENGHYRKIPQVGSVVIEDDVELGANCCIDRATVGATRIGRGSKIDNLVQIAHGVQIGENTVIAAQTGISGSTRIGSHVMMGGQVGLAGHLDIGDGMIIGAQAGVAKSFDIKGMISGYPARPQREELHKEAMIDKLSELFNRLKELEKKLKEAGKE